MNPEVPVPVPRSAAVPGQLPGNYPAGTITVREFVRRYASLGGHVPDTLRLDRYGAMEFPSALGLRPLVDGLLALGGLTAIVESRLVEPNLLSAKLLAALGRGEDVLAGRWRNLVGRPIRRLAFIDSERLTPYAELLRQFGETGDRDQDLLFHADFLGKPMEEGMADFKAILSGNAPQVVIFDTEAVPGEHAVRRLFREALRHGLMEGIALVVVVHGEKDLAALPPPAFLARVQKHGDTPFDHLVKSGGAVFRIQLQDGKLNSEDVKPDMWENLGGSSEPDSLPGTVPSFVENHERGVKSVHKP